ncbi:hypothetical protein [Nocardioides sp. GY 10113]|uniref:hypothetical protein n=1 Tax=Nocardioides sp. GY 10113 TaxID=2569761 RepID=UPI001F0EC8E5|nr:hypothetical protein [Nocardioides sp. GY 10113]
MAPTRVRTGQVFEFAVRIDGGGAAVSTSSLELTAPTEGEQVSPPSDVTLADGRATVATGAVAAGDETWVRLRWRAPAGITVLRLDATRTVDGRRDSAVAEVRVVADPGGTTFADNLATVRTTRAATTSPAGVAGRGLLCWTAIGHGTARTVPEFATARAQAQDLVAAQMVEAHADEWRSLPAMGDADLIDDLVLMALVDQRPAAALAAALRGMELAPDDAVHLTNAAVAAIQLDHSEWAVAFTERAGGLPLPPAVGADPEGLRLATMGHAWGMMGDYGRAEASIRRALAHDPTNPLIHQQLGELLRCQPDKAGALPHLRRSVRVDDGADPVVSEIAGSPELGRSYRPATEVYDLSGATDLTATVPALNVTLDQFVGLSDATGADGNGYYQAAYDAVRAEHSAVRSRRSERQADYFAVRAGFQPVQVQDIQNVLTRTEYQFDQPLLDASEALWQAQSALLDCTAWAGRTYLCGGQESPTVSCANARMVFADWLPRAQVYRERLLTWLDLYWKHASGLRATLATPEAHELAGEVAQDTMLGRVETFLWYVESASSALGRHRDETDSCFGSEAPTPEQQVDVEVVGGAPSVCTDDAKRIGGQIDLKVVTFKVTCEKWSLEAAAPLVPALAAFAKVEVTWAGNGATYYVGVKSSLPDAPVAWEQALYLETKVRNGAVEVTDFGGEAGLAYEAGVGIVVQYADDDKVRFSAMAAYADELKGQ